MRREIHIHKQSCIILFYLTSQFLLATIVQKNFNDLGLRVVNALLVIHHPERME